MQQKEKIKKEIYNREADFYRLFGQALTIPGFPLPKIYYISKYDEVSQEEQIPPMLIMEDLQMKACNVDFDAFDEEQVMR